MRSLARCMSVQDQTNENHLVLTFMWRHLQAIISRANLRRGLDVWLATDICTWAPSAQRKKPQQRMTVQVTAVAELDHSISCNTVNANIA